MIRCVRHVARTALQPKSRVFTAASNSSAVPVIKEFGIYPGTRNKVPYQHQFGFMRPSADGVIPCFRVLDDHGIVIDDAEAPPQLSQDEAVEMYTTMVKLQNMDKIFYDAQRQGRISFYMQSAGEEAIHIGSASALDKKDMVFAQYREAGVLMWRGFSIQQFADQCFTNKDDCSGGRQMPVHYGSKDLNFQTISSPLTTQLPQASGAAYAAKLAGEDRIVVCYFGEGAASEGDFHAALNFAATLEAPVLFFCRNNGYAISTHADDQYRGDGIAVRGLAYGIPTVRVDGNDLLAVRHATAEARALVKSSGGPVLLEAMTYRVGHHSTSDDSTRYRSTEEIKSWMTDGCPIKRFRGYMEQRGWWDDMREENLQTSERAEVMEAMLKAEKKAKPPIEGMFEDVYDEIPAHLLEQREQMYAHLKKFPEHYSLEDEAH